MSRDDCSDKSNEGQTAMKSLPPVGAYLCEATAKFASYWLNAAREARDAEKHGDALMFAEQAVNGWKNLAYSLARQAHYYLKTQTHFAESSVPSSTASRIQVPSKPVAWRREWDGDESDIGNWIYEDERPSDGYIWQALYAAEGE